MGLSVVLRVLLLSLLAISLHKGHGTAKHTKVTTTGTDLHLLQLLRQEEDRGQVLPLKEIEAKRLRRRSPEEEEEVEDVIFPTLPPGGSPSFQYLIQALEAMKTERDQAKKKLGEKETELNQLKEETSSGQCPRHHVPKCICPINSKEELSLVINEALEKQEKGILRAIEEVKMDLAQFMATKSESQKEILPSNVKRDCYEHFQTGNRSSGIYIINPRQTKNSSDHIKVWCDMDEEQLTGVGGGGWTVILQRKPLTDQDQVTFDRSWDEYKNGFGDPNTEYWIGNDILNILTSSGKPQSLRVDMMDWRGVQKFARYDDFYVSDENDDYRLKVGRFHLSSTAGDTLKRHHSMAFSTPERDNDASGANCASAYSSGFWYKACFHTSPTHPLLTEGKSIYGVTWYDFNGGDWTHMKKMTMKIMPRLD